MSEDLLYEKIYQKTQDCGRTQFVNLLQQNQIKIEELQKENEDLKNKQNKFEKDYKEMIEIQGQNGNYNYDSYMLGLYNGMEYIIALYENREPIYRSGKDVNFLHENNILTEFEKWLEETEKMLDWNNFLSKKIDKNLYLKD